MENRRHDARVVDGVGAGEKAALAVFEPFGEDVVATNLVGPEVGGNSVEVLGGVDVDAPTVGVVFNLSDGTVALATETADGVVELGRTHQVQVDDLLTQVGQLEEGVAVLGEGDAREIGLEKLGIPSPVGRRVENGVYIGKHLLRCRTQSETRRELLQNP